VCHSADKLTPAGGRKSRRLVARERPTAVCVVWPDCTSGMELQTSRCRAGGSTKAGREPRPDKLRPLIDRIRSWPQTRRFANRDEAPAPQSIRCRSCLFFCSGPTQLFKCAAGAEEEEELVPVRRQQQQVAPAGRPPAPSTKGKHKGRPPPGESVRDTRVSDVRRPLPPACPACVNSLGGPASAGQD
jgi:hypothetical protein